MVEFKNIGSFERYEQLSSLIPNVGDNVVVTFLDNGSSVSKEVLQDALRKSDRKNIKARDSEVFVVEHKGKKYEMWLSVTAYSNLRELKQIWSDNKDTLVNAKVKVSRVSKNDMTQQAFKFEKA